MNAIVRENGEARNVARLECGDAKGDDGIAAVIAALDAAASATGVGGHAEQIEVDQEGVRILRSVGVA